MQWLAIVLTAIFVMAKLMGIVAWSWWLVMLPALILLAFEVIVLLVTLLIAWFVNV